MNEKEKRKINIELSKIKSMHKQYSGLGNKILEMESKIKDIAINSHKHLLGKYATFDGIDNDMRIVDIDVSLSGFKCEVYFILLPHGVKKNSNDFNKFRKLVNANRMVV